MTDPSTPPTSPHADATQAETQTAEAPMAKGRAPEDRAERPDLGRKPDALIEALNGSDSGSDTRAGSLQGGVATGSDDDPDSRAINADLAAMGRASAQAAAPHPSEPDAVNNTGRGPGEIDPDGGEPGDDADAATG